MRPILVTGGTGQVGTALQALAERFAVGIVAPDREALDVTDPVAVQAFIGQGDWSAIINCAAFTAVDEAERAPERCDALNAVAPGLLASAAAARGTRLLHLSTDYVFDGAKPGCYDECDPVCPLGVYGASKEAGERAVRAAGGDHLIVRTAWVVSPWRRNFVRTMLRLAEAQHTVRVIDDQRGSPTSALDLAEALLVMAAPNGPRGTLHIVNSGEASWYDLARLVFERASLDVDLKPIASADYPTPARRPANSCLSTARLRRETGISPRSWQHAVGEIVDLLVAAR